MIKIGITGSLASGKSTASKILSLKKGPLFNADNVVKKLYSKKSFRKLITKKFLITNNYKLKEILKKKILNNKSYIKKLEKIVHPLVRKEMKKFIIMNKNKKFVFCEVPLLIESKLMKSFNIIFFIKAKRSIRLKRFIKKGGDRKLFSILDKKQLSDVKKIKYCNHVVVNEKNIKFLKRKLLDIFHQYE